MNKELLEQLAEAQHKIWSHWMKYLFSKVKLHFEDYKQGKRYDRRHYD